MVIAKQTNNVENQGDHNLEGKKTEKLDNYAELSVEVARMWNRETMVIPVIISVLGSIRKDTYTSS